MGRVLQPKLRFSEFTEEWEEKKLGDIAIFLKGKGLSKVDISKDGILDCIRYGELYTTYNELINNVVSKTNVSSEKLVLSQENDVIIPASGETALDIATASCILKSGIALGGDLNIIRSDVVGLFNAYYLNSARKNDIARLSQGSSVIHLYPTHLKTLKLHIPAKLEQEKIASFLSSIDEQIEGMERKKELMGKYKKGAMQKIFSQVTRFKDENGEEYPEWKEKKLGEILIEYRLGGNYKNSEIPTEYPLIKMGNLDRGKIKLNKIEYIVEDEKINEINLINEGDIFFNTRNTLDLVGKVAIWRNELPKAFYNSNLMLMRYNNNKFMNYRLNSFEGIKKLRSIATGTTSVAAIYTKDLLKIKLNIPSLSEQGKIADFLSSVDEQIESLEKEIEEMKKFKKGLLQGIFV